MLLPGKIPESTNAFSSSPRTTSFWPSLQPATTFFHTHSRLQPASMPWISIPTRTISWSSKLHLSLPCPIVTSGNSSAWASTQISGTCLSPDSRHTCRHVHSNTGSAMPTCSRRNAQKVSTKPAVLATLFESCVFFPTVSDSALKSNPSSNPRP